MFSGILLKSLISIKGNKKDQKSFLEFSIFLKGNGYTYFYTPFRQ